MYNLPEECLIRDKNNKIIGVKNRCLVDKFTSIQTGGSEFQKQKIKFPTASYNQYAPLSTFLSSLSSRSRQSLTSSDTTLSITDASTTMSSRRSSVSSSGSILSDLSSPTIIRPSRPEQITEEIHNPVIRAFNRFVRPDIKIGHGGIGISELPQIKRERSQSPPTIAQQIRTEDGGVRYTDIRPIVESDIILEDIEHEQH